jgi:hypothetical protein
MIILHDSLTLLLNSSISLMALKKTLLGNGVDEAFISRLQNFRDASVSLLQNAISLDSKFEMTPEGMAVANLRTIPTIYATIREALLPAVENIFYIQLLKVTKCCFVPL